MTAVLRCGICDVAVPIDGDVTVFGNDRRGVIFVTGTSPSIVAHACGPQTDNPRPAGVSRQDRRRMQRSKTPRSAVVAQRNVRKGHELIQGAFDRAITKQS